MKFDETARAALSEVLRWRRDVRHFRPDPLDEAVLDRLRAAMERAPSVGNSRPWRVLRVEDKALRAAVKASFQRCNAEAAAGYRGEKAQAYAQLKLQGMDQAPVQLAVFTETDPEAGAGLGRRTMPETLRQSTAMAIHTLWLAARAENVGMGMVSIIDPEEVAQILSAPANWAFEGWICLGHTEFDDDTPLLARVGWQEDAETVWKTV
ncbi:5,6-dimethylbenzimidazole synthase [Rhodovulum sp. DZ06]|uniref:5,6-dimethylbenzimidazole synthase n=1 Tax=Rhodovulum sp. DZ06 TaxID=3425126 RepID=UPI003D33473F